MNQPSYTVGDVVQMMLADRDGTPEPVLMEVVLSFDDATDSTYDGWPTPRREES